MNIILHIFTLSVLLLGSNAGTKRANRKNIVFILTDDQDRQMNSLEYMKHVQNLLIDEGALYSRHYAPTALCCPARVSVLTGLHAHNHRVTDVNGVNGGYKEIVRNGFNTDYLPIWLQNHGYDTYYTGKLYNGMDEHLVKENPVQGWTKADLLIGGNTYQYWHPSFQHIEGDRHGEVHQFPHTYNTNKVADYAYGYVEEAVKGDKPFFIAIAPVTPHAQVGHNAGPPVPAPKYKGTLPHAKVPRSKNFNPAHSSGVNFVWKLDRLNDSMEEKLDNHYQRRVESLQSVDDIVEGVVRRLKEANKLDDTYIIYSSDNGFHLGHHRLFAGKKFAFEEDINVPLIIRGPGVPKGMKTDIVSAHVDLAPTILKMAGIEQRKEFDGRPIAFTQERIESRTKADTDEHTAVEFWTGATYLVAGIKGKQVNSYKSVRLAGKGYDIMYAVHCLNNSHELYDMTTDPVQMNNLHPTAPSSQRGTNAFDSGTTTLLGFPTLKLLSRVDALLLVLKSCKAKECRHPWQQLHPQEKVRNLKDAMDDRYNNKYENMPKIRYTKCYKDGTIDLQAEGPQWNQHMAQGLVQERMVDGTVINLEASGVDTESGDWNYDMELLDDWE